MNHPPPRRAGPAGRVAFLARKAEISADLESGMWLRAIYEKHQASLPFKYAQFCKLVAKHIRKPPATQQAPAEAPANHAAPLPIAPSAPAKPAEQSARPRFTHNPRSRSRDELI